MTKLSREVAATKKPHVLCSSHRKLCRRFLLLLPEKVMAGWPNREGGHVPRHVRILQSRTLTMLLRHGPLCRGIYV